ncbi:MAG: ATP-binding protein [Bacteroidetes bacterium]|nr:MAG: ATP-binding protein [Bacteroidota bacterium]
MIEINPFILRNYLTAEYFCDRKKETELLLEKFNNQRNTTLFANRKMGKTGLIYHFMYTATLQESDTVCLYVDLFDSVNLDDFITKLSKEIAIKVYSKPKNILSGLGKIFSSIVPVVAFDSLSGMPQLEFNFRNEQQKQNSLSEIFHFLNNLNRPVILALDEFQQISKYPNQNMEAILRTHVQNMHNVNFVFAGSMKHIMLEMFGSVKRPFYQSTDVMNLGPIPIEEYAPFIQQKMSLGRKTIDKEAIVEILNQCRGYTYYIQSVCNKLYASTYKKIDITHVSLILNKILDESEDYYVNYKKILPEFQWKLMRAIALENGATGMTSKNFIQNYGLSTHGTIQTALKSLIEKEMVIEDDNKYYIQDVFLEKWLQKRG